MGCVCQYCGSFEASSSKRSVMIGLGCVELEALEKINQRNLCKETCKYAAYVGKL